MRRFRLEFPLCVAELSHTSPGGMLIPNGVRVKAISPKLRPRRLTNIVYVDFRYATANSHDIRSRDRLPISDPRTYERNRFDE
jgi:hypothetical protein